MNKTMDMTIATPEGIVFEGKVESAKFPGTSGAFTVLPRHAALISALTAGKITYTQEGKPTENVKEYRYKRIPFKIMLRQPNSYGRTYGPTGNQHQ